MQAERRRARGSSKHSKGSSTPTRQQHLLAEQLEKEDEREAAAVEATPTPEVLGGRRRLEDSDFGPSSLATAVGELREADIM